MKIEYIDTSKCFPFLIVDDFYDEKELVLIWKELDFLHDNVERLRESDDNVAVDDDGRTLASKYNVFVDHVYSNREYSNILRLHYKIFDDEIQELYKKIPSNRSMSGSNKDTTLLNYYEEGDYYKPHIDMVHHTSITWLFKEPKRFTGGDLKLEQSGSIIECKNNRLILFPSYYLHEVIEVKMEKQYLEKGLGRFSLTSFWDYLN